MTIAPPSRPSLLHEDRCFCVNVFVFFSFILCDAFVQDWLVKLVPRFSEEFKVVDVHTSHDPLKIQVPGTNKLYCGYIDGVVVPKKTLSYVQQMRLGIELKHGAADKARWQEGGCDGRYQVAQCRKCCSGCSSSHPMGWAQCQCRTRK